MPKAKLKASVELHFKTRCTLTNRTKLKSFIGYYISLQKVRWASLNVIFCSDEFLLNLNKVYLQHNYYTDILTFNLANAGQPIVAELYISVERVKENALVFNQPFQQEIHRVIFHGLLHLLGKSDKSKRGEHLMRAAENKLLSTYFMERSTWNK